MKRIEQVQKMIQKKINLYLNKQKTITKSVLLKHSM